MSKILIVGAGVTGAAIHHFLRSLAPASSVMPSIVLWEASSELGGRMSTDHHKALHCDLGAQYITKNSAECDDVYDHLLQKRVFALLDNTAVSGMRADHQVGTHYIAPQGTSSIVAALAEGAEVVYNKRLTGIDLDLATKKIVASSTRTGAGAGGGGGAQEREEFDVVVLSMLAPQVAAVQGNFLAFQPPPLQTEAELDLAGRLRRVRYSSRFALAAYYALSTEEKKAVQESVPWKAKYVFDDEVLRFVSMENFKYVQAQGSPSKRARVEVQVGVGAGVGAAEVGANDGNGNGNTDGDGDLEGLAVLMHTSVPFGLAQPEALRGEAAAVPAVEEQILQSLGRTLPALAVYDSKRVKTRLLGWEQSQISRGFYHVDAPKGAPPAPLGAPALVISKEALATLEGAGSAGATVGATAGATATISGGSPGIVLAGDAFTESNFEGCMRSARAAAHIVMGLP